MQYSATLTTDNRRRITDCFTAKLINRSSVVDHLAFLRSG
jgi:hypothetical protein